MRGDPLLDTLSHAFNGDFGVVSWKLISLFSKTEIHFRKFFLIIDIFVIRNLKRAIIYKNKK